MNLITKTTLAAVLTALTLASASSIAQNDGRPNRFLPNGGQKPAAVQEGEAGNAERPARPLPPLVVALDANKDGEIDATEIANAANALKSLDKNGDGKLTADELRPARPEGARGPGGGRPGHRKGHGQPRGE